MEETSGAVVQAHFGEPLIRDWLDEGDRLSASAADAPAPPPAPESRLRQVAQRLQPVLARHRLSVLAGIGLLPLALILCLNRSAPAQAPAATFALALPAAPESVPAPSAPPRLAPPPTLTSAATTAALPAAAPLASAGSADPRPAPHRHHHHHHHDHQQAASASGKGVASVGRAVHR